MFDHDFFDLTNFDPKLKKCNKCGELKEPNQFYMGSWGDRSVMAQCKKCHKTAAKIATELRKTHPQPTDPNYKCPCCLKTSEETTRGGLWMLDHCHKTHKFRAYVCHSCNLMLGNAKDDPETLRRGAEYLEATEILLAAAEQDVSVKELIQRENPSLLDK